MKKCPLCAEEIQDSAIKCRYCGSLLDSQETKPEARSPDPVEAEVRRLVAANRASLAIGLVQKRKGLGLKEATTYVKTLGVRVSPVAQPVQNATAKRRLASGKRLVVAIVLALSAFALAFVNNTLLQLGFWVALVGFALVATGGSWVARTLIAVVCAALIISPATAITQPSTPKPTVAPASSPTVGRPPASTSPQAPPPTSGETSSADQRATESYSAEQVAKARSVMENVRASASLEEDGTGLLVHFAYGILSGLEREQLYQLIDGIAYADVVLTGHRRYIYFRDPTGKSVGQASPVSGIKLEK